MGLPGDHPPRERARRRGRADWDRHPFVLQLDLRQFFPSIDHAVLRSILAAAAP
jgi:hypothetical protein